MELDTNDLHYSYLLICNYLLLGILMILLSVNIPIQYISLLSFFALRVIYNYRKCSISYIECKFIRKVNKEKGYLYRLINDIVDIRYHPHYPYFLGITLIILIFYYVNNISNLNLNLKQWIYQVN
jgi:hypothetical protein